MTRPPNILLIMSDEHTPSVCGAYGSAIAHTPYLDQLASQGTVFDNAYTSSPMCVPARMSFLTGEYPSAVNIWDNGSVLGSEHPTFANYLSAGGYETVLCGRMHMLGADRCHGFSTRLYDDMLNWLDPKQTPGRRPQDRRGSNSHVTQCGPGTGSWQQYDATCADLAKRYLMQKAAAPDTAPWLMVAGFMFPHFPLIAPKEFYSLYEDIELPLVSTRFEDIDQQHPTIAHLRRFFGNDQPLDDALSKKALKNYYALVALMDDYVGSLVQLIDDSPLGENTVVIYVSDHGEMCGHHGIWQKQCFYEPSVKIPLIMRTPKSMAALAPNRGHVQAPVSLVDLFPTLLALAGLPPVVGKPGISLLSPDPDRAIFSEYHAQGMLNGGFMLKHGRYKLCYYVNGEPQLFDVEADPLEIHDLHGDLSYSAIETQLIHMLQLIDSPEQLDAAAKKDQQKRLCRLKPT